MVLVTSGLLLAPGIGRADSGTYQISGGFTTFTGSVLGNAAPNYIRAFGLIPVSVDCSQINCSDPLLFFGQVCPDNGCTAAQGVATNYSLLTFGNDPTNYLTFESFSCPDIAICGNTPNELDFVPSNSSILVFNPNSQTDEMLLGQITFANGTWTGDASFGFTVTATDILAPHNAYTFNGYINMVLNSAPAGLTNPAQIAALDADYIYLANASNQPLLDPFTANGIGSVRAYELNNPIGASNTVTVNLYGTLGSLDPTRFGDLTGGGFFDISTTNALGGPGPGTGSVPEPGTMAMVGAGLLASVAFSRRWRRRSETKKSEVL
jgi:hypothetical protein